MTVAKSTATSQQNFTAKGFEDLSVNVFVESIYNIYIYNNDSLPSLVIGSDGKLILVVTAAIQHLHLCVRKYTMAQCILAQGLYCSELQMEGQ